MIFNKVIGNINQINNLNGYHVETIYLNSEDNVVRINNDNFFINSSKNVL